MKIKTLFIIATILFIFVAGKSDYESEPQDTNLNIIPEELVGSWILDINNEEKGVHQIFTRSFTKSDAEHGKYSYYWMFDHPDFGSIIVSAEKGDYTVNPTTVFMTPTEFGSERILSEGGMNFYDTTKWYFPGDERFPFGYFPECEYELIGDTLFWTEITDKKEVLKFIREDKYGLKTK